MGNGNIAIDYLIVTNFLIQWNSTYTTVSMAHWTRDVSKFYYVEIWY